MKKYFFEITGKNYRGWAPFVLRLVIGFGFMAHGLAKLEKGPESFSHLLVQLNIPFPLITAWISTTTELIGGLLLIVGLLTRIVTIPLIITMLVALFGIHIHYGFSAVKTIGLTPQGPVFGPPGYEINLVYIAGLISILLLGAGRYSADNVVAKQ